MKEAHDNLLEVLDLIERSLGEKGCPWIKEQTAEDHLQELKSEIKEIEKAIQNNDCDNLTEEIGDMLWDALMLARICQHEKNIDIKKSLACIRDKMIRRKPYLFGKEKAETAEEAMQIWQREKAKEKR